MASLLSLPIELRLQIYDFVIPKMVLTIEAKHYMGLLHTCQEIRHKIEPETCKAMALCVSRIAAKIRRHGDKIVYLYTFQNRPGLANLTVSRPRRKDMFSKEDPFLKFGQCWLYTLTATLYNVAEGFDYNRTMPYTYQIAAYNLAMDLSRASHKQRPIRWGLDWATYSQWYQWELDSELWQSSGLWGMERRKEKREC
jgi:hypothetical protein